MKKFICSILAFLILALCITGCASSSKKNGTTTGEATQDPRTDRYNEAFSLIQEGKLEEAYDVFLELGDFMDSKKQLENFIYMPIKQTSSKHFSTQGSTLTNSVEFTLDDKGFPIKIQTQHSDGRQTSYEFAYNDNGDFLKEVTIRPNYNQTKEYEYDKNGRLVKESVKSSLTFEGETTDSGSVTEYVYDTNGNLINETITLLNGTKTSYDYSYTESGKISNIVYTNKEGERKTTNEYAYDSEDRLVQHDEHRTPAGYGGDTIAEITTKYAYNDNGLKSRTEKYYDNKIYAVYEYFYNTDGTLSKEERTFYDGQDETIENFYDEHGNVIKHTYSYGIGQFKRSPFITKEYEYDDKGNMLKMTTDQGDNYLSTITYEYDDHGNVVKRVETRITAKNSKETTETEYQFVYLPCGLTEDVSAYFNLLIT